MPSSLRTLCVTSVILAGVALVLAPADAVAAAPDAATMCGTGETFNVYLRGKRMENDPATKQLDNNAWPDAQIDLPNGCDVYAIIVHGYGRNEQLDELMYYKLAKWVAEHNGYVHWSWWNNFLGPYMSGPLHDHADAPAQTPGDVQENAWDFALGGRGKAVPDDDYQFQSDALQVLERIREENPDAIVIVAGHSMGGNAVARLGSDSTVPIDLLAPIDPVGNRNLPEGDGGALAFGNGSQSAVPGEPRYADHNKTFNWTRWRAVFDFKGWIDRDCVRNAAGFCRDFDPRLLFTEYRCREISRENDKRRKAPGATAERACPDDIEYSRLRFGPEIRRLYHRWQKEAYFPYDWDADYVFALPSITRKQDVPFDVKHHNYQSVLPEYTSANSVPAPSDERPERTCRFELKLDPGGATSFDGDQLRCQDWDGHGEIIGMRATRPRNPGGLPPLPTRRNLNPLALTADWSHGDWERDSRWNPIITGLEDVPPCGSATCRRRRALVGMATPGEWRFAPRDPDLDLVVDDLVAIAEDLWAQRSGGGPGGEDTTAPVSESAVDPAPTVHGWHNADVAVLIAAADESGGSGVREISYTLGGASSGGAVVPAAEFELQVAAEGVTTVHFHATDNAGNAEQPQVLEVRIDRTPPLLEADLDTPANQHGWHNTDVTVTFAAADDLSGIDSVSDPVTLVDEGEAQEALGIATDRAGNIASRGVIVNIDRTPPDIDATADPQPNEYGWNNTDVTVTFQASDGLSGIDSVTAPVTLKAEGADQEVQGMARDRAGNTASSSVTVSIDKSPPVIGGLPGSCELWPANHKMVDVATIVVADALSGLASDHASAASNEPETGPTFGNTAPDVLIAGGRISLRAERYSKAGRNYDLAVAATDRAGNSADGKANCSVPHDRRK